MSLPLPGPDRYGVDVLVVTTSLYRLRLIGTGDRDEVELFHEIVATKCGAIFFPSRAGYRVVHRGRSFL
jgi:hypothetical protein